MKAKNIITGSWLPIFSGFYGTIWESKTEVDYELDYINNESGRNPKLPKITYEDLDIDYSRANNDLSKKISYAIFGELESEGFIESGKFERLSSPRYYNFYNDAIHVEYTFNQSNVNKIKKYIKDNFKEWTKYLKDTYTSRSGFFSSYSNHPDDSEWSDIEEALSHNHLSGALLNFILANEGFEEWTVYDRVEFYMGEYIKVNEPEISEELKEEIQNDIVDPNQLKIDL